MRKLKVVVAVALATVAGAGAVRAQTATQAIVLNASVPHICTVGNVASGPNVIQAVPITAAGSVNTAPINLNGAAFNTVACNSAATIQLSSLNNGVLNAGAPVAGFSNVINYTAAATWNTVTANLTTTGGAAPLTGVGQSVASAASGSLSVTITPIANATPLVTGSFTDTLTVSLIPQ